MPWRLRLSVETLLRLTPAALGSTVLSIAGLCAGHECLDDGALLAAREVIGSSLQTLCSVYAVLLAFVVYVVWQQFKRVSKSRPVGRVQRRPRPPSRAPGRPRRWPRAFTNRPSPPVVR